MNKSKLNAFYNRMMRAPRKGRGTFRKKLRNWKRRYRDWMLVRRGDAPRPSFTLEVDSAKHIVTRKFHGGKHG